MKRRSVLFAAAAMTLAAVPYAGPAWAAEPLTELEEAERFFVRWLSVHDERALVRSAARAALAPGDVASITNFLAIEGGYDKAMERAATTLARHISYTQRMVNTHPVQYYPWVNNAGRRALIGSEAELAYFVNTGYQENLARDKQGIADDKLRADLVKQADRDYVIFLSENDPGDQVRAWAGRAVAEGTTDKDVAEFLNYGWVSASKLDTQTFRRQCADADKAWLVTSRGLVKAAEDAELKARNAADEAKAQLRAAAAREWALVGAQTSAPRVAWANAEQVALQQAEVWLQISIAAASATSPHWQTIAGTSLGTREEWLKEQQAAAEQAASWLALFDKAVKAEAALLDPNG
ncbi:hypothetical protein OHA21_33250 [Actinoplanes sp. NBC_00393]|uniref:hypothetical protein n=1 Tax=Actinoplanes sp. NBC_00393 TaxID=2975953 RepID=UPI002E22C422